MGPGDAASFKTSPLLGDSLTPEGGFYLAAAALECRDQRTQQCCDQQLDDECGASCSEAGGAAFSKTRPSLLPNEQASAIDVCCSDDVCELRSGQNAARPGTGGRPQSLSWRQ